jgi:hypothetical protein
MQVAHRVGHVVSFSAQHDRSRGCGEKELKNEFGIRTNSECDPRGKLIRDSIVYSLIQLILFAVSVYAGISLGRLYCK